jgi:hypothetical protein
MFSRIRKKFSSHKPQIKSQIDPNDQPQTLCISGDPRSPFPNRTPLKTSQPQPNLNDPRSPLSNRTPIQKCQTPQTQFHLDDPRSPLPNRTPIQKSQNLQVNVDDSRFVRPLLTEFAPVAQIIPKNQDVDAKYLPDDRNASNLESKNQESCKVLTSNQEPNQSETKDGKEVDGETKLKPQVLEALMLISRSPQLRDTLKSLSPKKKKPTKVGRKRSYEYISEDIGGMSPNKLKRHRMLAMLQDAEQEQIELVSQFALPDKKVSSIEEL